MEEVQNVLMITGALLIFYPFASIFVFFIYNFSSNIDWRERENEMVKERRGFDRWLLAKLIVLRNNKWLVLAFGIGLEVLALILRVLF